MHAASLDRATQQYLKALVSRAKIEGVNIEAEKGLLVRSGTQRVMTDGDAMLADAAIDRSRQKITARL